MDCPTLSAVSSLRSVTLNWNTLLFAVTLPDTAPVAASIAVIEQHGGDWAVRRAPPNATNAATQELIFTGHLVIKLGE
jgi:hypothetical protein